MWKEKVGTKCVVGFWVQAPGGEMTPRGRNWFGLTRVCSGPEFYRLDMIHGGIVWGAPGIKNMKSVQKGGA